MQIVMGSNRALVGIIFMWPIVSMLLIGGGVPIIVVVIIIIIIVIVISIRISF
jgi:hypothetical protein